MKIALVGVCLVGLIATVAAAIYALVRALRIANDVSRHIRIGADSPWFVRLNPFNAFLVSSCLTPEGLILRRKLVRATFRFLVLAILVVLMNGLFWAVIKAELGVG